MSFFREKTTLARPEPVLTRIRGLINVPVNSLQRIIEHIIKVDQKYKKRIIDWFYTALLLNDTSKKVSKSKKVTSEKGWSTNLLLLLLKLCERFLEDTSRYPAWFDKIDITYIQGKKIWSGVQMLNNTPNLESSSKDREESKIENKGDEKTKKDVPKYSFLTELVFLTAHALFLQESANSFYTDLLKIRYEVFQNSGLKSPQYAEILKKVLGYEVQLIDPYLLNQIFAFLTFQSLLILHKFGIPLNNYNDILSDV